MLSAAAMAVTPFNVARATGAANYWVNLNNLNVTTKIRPVYASKITQTKARLTAWNQCRAQPPLTITPAGGGNHSRATALPTDCPDKRSIGG